MNDTPTSPCLFPLSFRCRRFLALPQLQVFIKGDFPAALVPAVDQVPIDIGSFRAINPVVGGSIGIGYLLGEIESENISNVAHLKK